MFCSIIWCEHRSAGQLDVGVNKVILETNAAVSFNFRMGSQRCEPPIYTTTSTETKQPECEH